MTDKFRPKAPAGIPINIFKKLASAQGTMGKGKGISSPFPASPGRTFFSPLPLDLPYDTKSPLRSRERERPRKLHERSLRIRHCINEQRTRAEIHPQVFLGLLVWKSRSAIGQFFSLSLVTVPEVLTRVKSSQFTFCIS